MPIQKVESRKTTKKIMITDVFGGYPLLFFLNARNPRSKCGCCYSFGKNIWQRLECDLVDIRGVFSGTVLGRKYRKSLTMPCLHIILKRLQFETISQIFEVYLHLTYLLCRWLHARYDLPGSRLAFCCRKANEKCKCERTFILSDNRKKLLCYIRKCIPGRVHSV